VWWGYRREPVLPEGFLTYSSFLPKESPECYSRIRSGCVDMHTGDVVIFKPPTTSQQEPAQYKLKTCYRPACQGCAKCNPKCSGYGLVNVRTEYQTLANALKQGAKLMPNRTGAAFLSTWTIEGSLWHVILDSFAGFWQNVHKMYDVGPSPWGTMRCPDMEVFFTNDILHKRDEAKCISTAPNHSPGTGCGAWKDAAGLLFYSAVSATAGDIQSVKDLQSAASIKSQMDLPGSNMIGRLQCYKDIHIGYPPLNGEYADMDNLLTDFGDCLLQRNTDFQMESRRPAAMLESDIKIVVIDRQKCERKIQNADALLVHLQREYSKVRSSEIVYFEGMDPKQQLAIMADADIVIAAHGAALGWISVMPTNAAVIVLRPYPNSYGRDYLYWSKWSDVKYYEWAATDFSKIKDCANPDASWWYKWTTDFQMRQTFEVPEAELDAILSKTMSDMLGRMQG